MNSTRQTVAKRSLKVLRLWYNVSVSVTEWWLRLNKQDFSTHSIYWNISRFKILICMDVSVLLPMRSFANGPVRKMLESEGVLNARNWFMSVKKPFASFHGIESSRLKTKDLNCEYNIADKWGRHANNPKLSLDNRNLVRDHIRKFQARENHYSCLHKLAFKYLKASLSIAKMHTICIGKPCSCAQCSILAQQRHI